MNLSLTKPRRDFRPLGTNVGRLAALAAGLLAVLAMAGCEMGRENEASGGGAQIDHKAIEQKVGSGGTEIRAYVLAPDAPDARAVTLHYRTAGKGGFNEVDMPLEPGWNAYGAMIPEFPKGTKVDYFITAGSETGEWLASYPPRVNGKESWISFRYKGEIWPPLMAVHVAVMFAGLIAIAASLLYGVATLWNTQALQRCAYATCAAALFTFIGGIPIGILVSRQRFGPPGWTGIPVGTDITDSKTLIIVLWWIIAAILAKGSILRRDPQRNWARPSRLGWFVVIGAFVSIALYLVPHSI